MSGLPSLAADDVACGARIADVAVTATDDSFVDATIYVNIDGRGPVGLGMASKIAIGALAVIFVVLLNLLAGLKRPEVEAINLMRSFGAGPLGILFRLRFPAAMPQLVTGLRVGLARSTIAVIVAEMMGAYSGIGQVIYQATGQVDYLTVWAAVFVAMLGSLALYGVLVAIDRKLVWWR